MNKILLFLSAIFLTTGIFAQVPEKMSYQAVVRNGKKELITNRQIGLRISIIHGSVNGAAVYQEVFQPNPVTNVNGLVTAEIGSGTPTLGTFSSINWANGPYFIKAETDTTGGSNYIIAGTTQLVSVPYALHAKTAESVSGKIPETDPFFSVWKKEYNDLTNKPDLSSFATKDMINQNPFSLNYNDLTNKPDLSVFATKDQVNQTNSGNDYNNIINKPDLSIFVTKDMVNQLSANINYNEVTNKPELSIYATKNMANRNITNLANAVNPQDAATKADVDVLKNRIQALVDERKLLNDGFYDERDGNFYQVVKIGNQIWMAENLKYLPALAVPPFSHTEPGYNVIGYEGTDLNEARATKSFKTYGVLYNWPAAMNEMPGNNSNPVVVQGVCPSGWHLPSRAEWDQLIGYLGGKKIAGGKMKETGTRHWWYPNAGATNESGFKALPGGEIDNNDLFSETGENGYFWSSSTNHSVPDFIFITFLQDSVSFLTLVDSLDFVRINDPDYWWWDENYDEDLAYYLGFEIYIEETRINTRKRKFSVRCVKD